MLSVVHVCTDFWPSTGGIEQFVAELAQNSLRNGIRATVLCFNRTKGFPGTLPARESLNSIEIVRIPFVDLVYYKPSIIPLAMLRSHDIVHVHGVGAPLDFVALTKWIHRRPIVVSTHGGIFHTQALGTLKRLYFYAPLRLVIRQADAVAACSRSDAELFCEISNRVTLLENAVGVEPFLALKGTQRQGRRCLYVGRLSDNKGIDLLLRAVAVARGRGSDLTLRLVGPDVEGKHARYESLANSLRIANHVTFVGEVSRQTLLEEFDLADIFVSASRYEGFGISAIEARAAGCKLLLHGNEAFRSLFESDSAVTLVDFTEPDRAGAALAGLLEQPPDPDILESRRSMLSFSWDNKMVEWLRLYRKVSR